MTEVPVSMYIIVQRGQTLKLRNPVILITSVRDRLQSVWNSFGQNHSDINKELGAKVTVAKIHNFKREPNILKE